MVAHCLNNGCEEAHSGRSVLKQYLRLDLLRISHHVFNGKGIHKPCTNTILVHLIHILDVVFAGATVAFNTKFKKILDGVLPVMERTLGYLQRLVRIDKAVVSPFAINIFSRDMPGRVDGICQPDILAKC